MKKIAREKGCRRAVVCKGLLFQRDLNVYYMTSIGIEQVQSWDVRAGSLPKRDCRIVTTSWPSGLKNHLSARLI